MESSEKELAPLARKLRADILKISFNGKTGHVGSALSIIDLLTVLYGKILKVDPTQPKWPLRDRFLLSKGHAAAALYAVLCRRGFFSEEELFTFCKNGSRLAVHPEDTRLPGLEFASGSLGHGLAIANGLALAAKQTENPFRVFVLLSDAECNEGSIWEAALFSAQHRLDNLTVMVDYNKMQALGPTEKILRLDPFMDKWRSFGWGAAEVDGHNLQKLEQKFARLPLEKDKPSAFIAHTVLGKGVSFMEGKLDWHYLTMNEGVYQQALQEVE